MKDPLIKRTLLLLVGAGSVKVAGPDGAGPLMIVLGVLLIVFSLLVLPGWWLKFRSVPATITQFPATPIRWPLDLEIAESKGQGIVFEYEVNGVVMRGTRDRRWSIAFKPFSGSVEAVEEARKACEEKTPITAYIEEGNPANAYLVVKTDWSSVFIFVFFGLASICIGALSFTW